MLKAGALLYTIGICLVIGILTSSLILYSYYNRQEFLNYQAVEKISLNSGSGINLLLTNSKVVAIGETKRIDLFGEGTDSIQLQRKTWGLFELGISEAFLKGIRNKKIALLGYKNDSAVAIY